MLIKVISLTFDSAFAGFRDDELRGFLKDKELISAQDYLIVKNEIPYLVFVLKYYPYRAEIESKPAAIKEKSSEAWRENLSEHDMGLFNLLRDWRSQRCKKEGVPPYVIFTNHQLAAIVKRRPQSNSELTQIDGVGKAKVQKYGEEILAISRIDLSPKGENKSMVEENGKSV
jgi:superfamily II DNA helicase RecQ